MNTVLLIGAGKSATVLIDYLIAEAQNNTWKVMIADANQQQVLAKTNNSPFAEACALDVTNDDERAALIQRASLVISMMPPALHFLVAKDCVQFGKHLLTASYLDEQIKGLEAAITAKQLLFLCEMGLDPGIDHMSAMLLFDKIKAEAGKITSFKSHCGGLIAPESDTNPWHYKISWNPRNVVLAGKAGAVYLQNSQQVKKDYQQLFADCAEVEFAEIGKLAYYPNRDSLSYIPIYQLEDAATFIRTTLRYPAFCNGWQAVVAANLTDETTPVDSSQSFKQWSAAISPYITDANRQQLTYLGLFEDAALPPHAKTSADVLQYLLETKWIMEPADKDMIVMLHEIEYQQNNQLYKTVSSLLVKGDNSLRTAMAKTVGLPLGIAAKLILNGTIQLTGVHIPIQQQVYRPVLAELEKQGILFKEETTTITTLQQS
ncbi:MAG: hypothetical protein RL172_190 [Bacteroidota bacterium]